jgi:PKD repeat protein
MKSAIRLLAVSAAALMLGASWSGSSRAAAPVLDPIANMSVGNCAGTADQEIRATDADGDPITFSKVSGPTFMVVVTLSSGTGTATGNIHLAPTPADVGTFAASVAATASGESDTKSFVITAVPSHPQPTFNQPPDMTVNEGATANQFLSGTHPCGGALFFSKVAGPAFMTVTTLSPGTGTGTGNINLAPGFSDAGTYVGTVRMSDGYWNLDKNLTITVNNVNRAPILTQPANMTVPVGASADQSITATDADGDPLFFSKVAGPAFMTVTTTTPGAGTATGNIHLAPACPAFGTFAATVSASDGTLSDSKSLTITISAVNRAPILNQPANMSVFEGAVADQTITATDPDCAPLAFFKVAGPSFMTVTTTNPGPQPATGNIHLGPGFADSGTYTASVSASDGSLGDSKSFTITVGHADRPPVLSQPSNMTVDEGGTANQPISATDPDGDLITFSSSGPAFMTLTSNAQVGGTRTGNIHLAPGFSEAGTHAAAVTATSSDGADTKSFAITVNSVNRPPTLAQPTNMTVTEGFIANQTLAAADPDGDPVTFSKAAGPTFMTVTTTNPTSGNINLAPGFSDAGTYSASVSASDGISSDGKSLMVTVNNTCRPHVINPISDMVVAPGGTAEQTITATSSNQDPITFTSTGPAFMTLVNISPGPGVATARIQLNPSPSTPLGNYPATISATTTGQCPATVTTSFTITVACLPTLNAIADMTLDEGTSADQIVTGSDPCGNPLAFSKVAGPIFMTVATTSPTTGNTHLMPGFADAGTYTATVRASDGPFSDSKSFMIFVNPVCSGQPVANPGGPYVGIEAVPISFDGSGSFDPNGDPLTFMWNFGDGSTGVGVMPVHTYTAFGTYQVTLTVTGSCGTGTNTTTATIQQACEALAFADGSNRTIRLNSGRPKWCVQIEPREGCYRNEDVILSSIVMKYTGGIVPEIHAIADKTVIDTDTNRDGINEITACFRKEDLRQLFSGLPGGPSTVVVTLEGDLATGGAFQAPLVLSVFSGGATAVTVAPNPFNPSGTLTFTTARAGRAKVELFDVRGRLVRMILDEPSLAAGPHEVKIEGRGQRGEPLASGIYFIRGASVEGAFTKTITILK